MARLARLTLADQTHHVLQRGNNRQPIALDDEDRCLLLDILTEQAAQMRVALHGYVLAPHQFQLLLTPSDAAGVPTLMQAVGRSYVRRFNARHGRTGTLWEGRYRGTLIQPERFLLDCLVLFDLEPVREHLVLEPAAWPWSSHRHHMGLANDRRITTHPVYWTLGNTPFAREAAYAEMVRTGVAGHRAREIERAVWQGWVLGDPAFVDGLQALTPRRLQPARAGRPKKAPSGIR
jgi:putative transposase